jgi:hypothetical protein
MLEVPDIAQAKEETAHSWSASNVGAPITLGNVARTYRKKELAARLKLLGTSNLTEGVM